MASELLNLDSFLTANLLIIPPWPGLFKREHVIVTQDPSTVSGSKWPCMNAFHLQKLLDVILVLYIV
jgi:hypothetical protein